MKIGTTAIILTKVSGKIDHEAIERSLATIKLPQSLKQEFKEICLGIIVRGDDFYPEEHYRTGDALIIALQFDPEKVLSLPIEAVTQMVCEKFDTYLRNISISDIEEREYTMMME